MNQTVHDFEDESPAETDSDTVGFLRLVGERVRLARARKAKSRKALSEASGVSQRYLAQLESGHGNISIALLRRVCAALGESMADIVAGPEEEGGIHALFAAATSEQRQQAFAILDPGHPTRRRSRRIALIGLRGAGKSTLGRMAAADFSMPFVELNHEIERESGMAVNELIALYGQEGYRRLERQTVEEIAGRHDAMVLAVAGGIVSEAETFAYLLEHFHTIWLKARPEEHMARVRAQGDTRPMAGNPAAMEALKSILTSREALYEQAPYRVDTSGRSLEQSLKDLRSVIDGAILSRI